MTGKGAGFGNSIPSFELLEPRVLLSTSSNMAGLLGEYYLPGGTLTDFPNYSSLTPVHSRIDGQVNSVSGTADFGGYTDLDDNFAVRWTGKINITAAGTNPVIFYTQSDDGSRLYIDNQLVVNNAGVHSMTEASGTISLAAGMHDLRLEYFEQAGGAGVILSYDPADGTKQVIPAGVLYHVETNLLNNPGFETGTTAGWDTNSDSGISGNAVHTGTYAERLYNNGYWISQDILSQLTAGVEYTFSAYVQVTVPGTSGGAPKLRVSLNQDLSSPDFGEATAIKSTTDWQKLEVRHTFTVSDLTQPGIFVGVINDTFNGRSKVDDVFVGLIGVAPAPVPVAPTGLTATANSPTQVTLGWNDNSSDETGFYLDRSPNGTTWNQTFDLPAGTRSYVDTGLTPGATYFYRVRAYSANGISAPSGTVNVTTQTEPVFLVPTEVMYHPAIRTDGKNLEFIELYNSDSSSHDLSGYTFSDGITLTFAPGTTIAAHGYLVLAANPADIRSAYGLSASIPIIAYTGTLDDNGERVRLTTGGGTVQFDFNYDDTASWPVAADGAGHSLVLKDAAVNPSLAASWIGSAQIGGSPATAAPTAPAASVMLNEYLANPGSGGQDFIELYNPTGASITLDGYYLSHDAGNLKQFRIPNGTTIAAGGFVYFTQAQLGFDLSGAGDDIYLTNPAGTRVVDATRFDATPTGMSFGRYRDGQNNWQAMTAPTAGTANVNPFVGDVVINEIMYHPPDLAVYPVDNVKEEFVELYNKGSYSVDLGGWYFKGIDFEFAPGTVIGAGQYLVVVADVAGFKAHYGSGITNIVGAYGLTSKLDNSGESVQLFNSTDFLIDKVKYGDYAPWPINADGSSTSQYYSIELINPTVDNDTPRNWKDSPAGATPGRQNAAYNAAWQPAWIQNTKISEDPAAPGSNQPAANQPITVTAEVLGATSPVLSYLLNFSATPTQISMFDDGLHGDGAAGDGVYGATIPAQPGSTYIRYKVTATSTVGGVNPQDPVTFDASLKWHGTVVRDSTIVTNAPVYYWLINPATFTMGNSGTGAFFYNGEYYEGVSYGPRGNTASSFWKKHYGFHFPVGHKFHGVGDTSSGVSAMRLNSANDDKTYARDLLVFDTFNATGTPAPEAVNVRVQMGGQFFGSYIQVDNIGGNFLEKMGLNDQGSLYKAEDGANWTSSSLGAYVKQNREWDGGLSNKTDLATLFDNMNSGQDYLFDNINIPEVVNYIAVVTIVDQWDAGTKNLFLYRDVPTTEGGTGRWSILPWDADMAFGQYVNLNDKLDTQGMVTPSAGGYDGLIGQMYASPRIRTMIYRRMRTLLDELMGTRANPQSWFEDILARVNNAIDPAETHFDYPGKVWNSGNAQPQIPQAYVNYSDGSLTLADYARENNLVSDVLLDQDKWGWKDKQGWITDFPTPYPSTPAHRGMNYYNTFDDAVARLKAVFLNGQRDFLYGQSLIPAAQGAAPTITIDPVTADMYSPAAPMTPDQEYLVLRNPGTVAVDLSGWSISGGIDYVFPGGTVLDAGGVLYVTADAAAFLQRSSGPRAGQGLFVVGGWKNHLSNLGETLELRKADNTLISQVSYVGTPTAAQQDLRLTEMMYNPPSANDDLEYLEMLNAGSGPLDVSGVSFTAGVTYSFPAATMLAAGERVVLVHFNPATEPLKLQAFRNTYGLDASVRLMGPYIGTLSNGGEKLSMDDALGNKLLEFTYSDGGDWTGRADGHGSSLELIDPNLALTDRYAASNWRPSAEYNGTPGSAGAGERRDVQINEVLTHTDSPQSDSVELYNNTDSAIDISGWYLSDSTANYLKYRIPAGTILPARGYVVFNESDFNPTPLTPGLNDFSFNGAQGDDVYLVTVDAAGQPLRFVDHVSFGAAFNGVSYGRLPNGTGPMYPMQRTTLGYNNSSARTGPIVISEVMYHPTDLAGGIDDTDNEYIELYNPTASAITLASWYNNHGNPASFPWRLAKGVDYTFPLTASIPSHGSLLVVSFDPLAEPAKLAAFRAKYGIGTGVTVLGPWVGKLSNSGESIELQWPDEPPVTDPTVVPYIVMDQVSYGVASPWPTAADGQGQSLTRRQWMLLGDEAGSWSASTPTPGSTSFAGSAGPTVTAAVINAGQTQRSIVTQLRLTFSQDVGASLAGSDLVVHNLTTGQDLPASALSLSYDSVTRTAIWSWPTLPNGTLAEGQYLVTLLAGSLSDTSGSPLDGDGNGTAGDDYTLSLHRLPGDVSGDGTVDIGDLGILGFNYGKSGPNMGGDMNGDGMVDVGDLGILGANYGRTVSASGLAGGLSDDSLVQSFSPAREAAMVASPAPAAELSSPLSPEAGAADVTADTLTVAVWSPAAVSGSAEYESANSDATLASVAGSTSSASDLTLPLDSDLVDVLGLMQLEVPLGV